MKIFTRYILCILLVALLTGIASCMSAPSGIALEESTLSLEKEGMFPTD